MAIKERTGLYEILVRFSAGEFVGAHVKDLHEIYDTKSGEVHSQKETAARPVTLEEVGSILGDQGAALIEAAHSARAERDGLASERDTLQTELEDTRAAVTAGEAEVARLTDELKAMTEAAGEAAKLAEVRKDALATVDQALTDMAKRADIAVKAVRSTP